MLILKNLEASLQSIMRKILSSIPIWSTLIAINITEISV